MHLLEDLVQLTIFVRRKNAIPLIVHVVIRTDDLLDLNQVDGIALGHQFTPRLPPYSPREHLGKVMTRGDSGTIDSARYHRPQNRAKVVLVQILDGTVTNQGQHICVKRAYELGVAIPGCNA